jgi:hypothetical protein
VHPVLDCGASHPKFAGELGDARAAVRSEQFQQSAVQIIHLIESVRGFYKLISIGWRVG